MGWHLFLHRAVFNSRQSGPEFSSLNQTNRWLAGKKMWAKIHHSCTLCGNLYRTYVKSITLTKYTHRSVFIKPWSSAWHVIETSLLGVMAITARECYDRSETSEHVCRGNATSLITEICHFQCLFGRVWPVYKDVILDLIETRLGEGFPHGWAACGYRENVNLVGNMTSYTFAAPCCAEVLT